MTSITWGQHIDSSENQISIPQINHSANMYEAALAYAESGWFVLPIDKNTKHAGSILGTGWPEKSSRDPVILSNWFEKESASGIALHVGRSGAIAFDVDQPSALPYNLRQWIVLESTPFQSTRDGVPLRGHYLFKVPKGSNYGNSKGFLKGPWGDVRGKNGIIVVWPTPHSKSNEGGQYIWKRFGALPILPVSLRKSLPESRHQSVLAVSTKDIADFFAEHRENNLPLLLNERLKQSEKTFASTSRHAAGRDLVLECLKDAAAKLYDAKTSIEFVAHVFESHKPQSEWSSPSEFLDIVRWAVAQVRIIPIEELNLHRESQLTLESSSFQKWVRGQND